MFDISQEYFDDEDIASDDDNIQDSDGFSAQSQEEYDDAGAGPVETGRYNKDGQSVSSSSNVGKSDEVSSVIDLDPELQAIKGLPAETEFYSIHL